MAEVEMQHGKVGPSEENAPEVCQVSDTDSEPLFSNNLLDAAVRGAHLKGEQRIDEVEQSVKKALHNLGIQAVQKNYVISTFTRSMHDVMTYTVFTILPTIVAILIHLVFSELKISYETQATVECPLLGILVGIWSYSAWKMIKPWKEMRRYWEAMELLEAYWPAPVVEGCDNCGQGLTFTEMDEHVDEMDHNAAVATNDKDDEEQSKVEELGEITEQDEEQKGAGDCSPMKQQKDKDV